MTKPSLFALLIIAGLTGCSAASHDKQQEAATGKTSTPALASSGEPSRSNTLKLEGMDYRAARKIILSYGWQPLRGPCTGVDDKACKRFPEIGNCSGTGLGFCDMNFARKDRCLVIVTTEGPPSDGGGTTQIRDVSFSRGPCAKDSNDQ